METASDPINFHVSINLATLASASFHFLHRIVVPTLLDRYRIWECPLFNSISFSHLLARVAATEHQINLHFHLPTLQLTLNRSIIYTTIPIFIFKSIGENSRYIHFRILSAVAGTANCDRRSIVFLQLSFPYKIDYLPCDY